MNEVKVGKLPIIASYICNLFQNYFKVAKICQTDCFMLQVSAVSKLESVLQAKKKKIKFYVIANEEMGATTFNSQ